MIPYFNRRNCWLLAGCALVITMTVVIVLFVAQTITISRARGLLAKLEAVPIENLSRNEVEKLAESYGAHKRDCTESGCEYFFEFNNAPLSKLQLARLTRLSVYVDTDAERARNLVVNFGREGSRFLETGSLYQFPVSLEVVQTLCAPPCNPDRRHYVYAWPSPAQVPMRMHTHLPPTTSLQQRREALAFNLGCLRKIGGCRDVREMLLPEGWTALDHLSQEAH